MFCSVNKASHHVSRGVSLQRYNGRVEGIMRRKTLGAVIVSACWIFSFAGMQSLPDFSLTAASASTVRLLPTVVELSSFTATSTESSIKLRWETESEANNAGFYIYRAESENGDYIKITSTLILAKGSTTQGASYEFTDTEVQKLKTYYYKLEDIDLLGTSRTHGPVHSTVGVTETTTIPVSTTTTTAPDGQCAVETVYGEHSEETVLLREYRDTVLSTSEAGRRMTRTYYALSPAVAEYLRNNEAARIQARKMIDSLIPAIREKLDR